MGHELNFRERPQMLHNKFKILCYKNPLYGIFGDFKEALLFENKFPQMEGTSFM